MVSSEYRVRTSRLRFNVEFVSRLAIQRVRLAGVIDCKLGVAAPVICSFPELRENGRNVTIGNALKQAILPHSLTQIVKDVKHGGIVHNDKPVLI